MMNIKKRSEQQEEFRIKKIERSIKSAGADEKTAQKISESINHKDGLKTSDVRKLVIEKLSEHDGNISTAYETFKKPLPVKK